MYSGSSINRNVTTVVAVAVNIAVTDKEVNESNQEHGMLPNKSPVETSSHNSRTKLCLRLFLSPHRRQGTALPPQDWPNIFQSHEHVWLQTGPGIGDLSARMWDRGEDGKEEPGELRIRRAVACICQDPCTDLL